MLKWLAGISEKRRILALFLSALLFRLLYFFFILYRNDPEGFLIYDSYGYIQIASNLIDNGSFSQSFISPIEPDYFRTPVYPLFLSVFKVLEVNIWTPVLVQLVLSSFTAVVVYQVCSALKMSLRSCIVAALIFCIEPASICFSTLILTESLFVLLFTWSILFLVRFLVNNKARDFYLFAFLFGFATLTRPAPVYLSFVIFPLMLFIRSAMWPKIVNGILIFILVLSPWFARNTITFGKPFLTKLDDEMLLFYHASSIVSEKDKIPLKDAQMKLRTEVLSDFDGDPKSEVTRYASFVRDRAMKIIRENSSIYIKHHVYGVISIALKPVRGYFDSQAGYVKGYQSITPGEFPANQKMRKAFFAVSSKFSLTMVMVQVSILAFCYLFFFRGILKIRSTSIYSALLFLLILFYFLNMVVPPFSEGRLRLPLMPFIIIIGTAGFYNWLESRKSRQS